MKNLTLKTLLMIKLYLGGPEIQMTISTLDRFVECWAIYCLGSNPYCSSRNVEILEESSVFQSEHLQNS